ncbi:preprotein translocase subunit SecE [Athalassotoga saccharophila]|uniref:preprotein translocase subunit SecE n=1 Tax=Athalassotoga saccharophila TaxID=1441386 RepID=UPI0013798ED5|nr:preprotein translocase subunit SecE [Athalassotoga saccharophila]BBJ27713.1 preprotein translocase subunit SecE [Athalassotoga saccharophila]
MADVGKFFREVKSEAQKTNWPTRGKLLSSAGIVLLILVVTGVYFWLLDLGFSNLTSWLLSALGIR